MARIGFIGPTYKSQSPTADPEECINLYVENMEASGKSKATLYGTPGLIRFAAIDRPVRGLFEINGNGFAVGGASLYRLVANGNAIKVGAVATDGLVVSMAASPTQLAVASGGKVYVLNIITGNFQQVPEASFPHGPVSQIGYSDGFFVAITQASDLWQVSALSDALTWPPLAITTISVFPENIVSMKIDHRDVWLFGQKQTVVYTNAGDPIFPYEVIPGSLIEQGSIAPNSTIKMDNSIFTLGGGELGAGIFWRSDGYALKRISTFAIETQVQGFLKKYGTISDCVGYSYQDQGHTFGVWRFPTANKTLVYDCAALLWHKREYSNNGNPISHLSQCHAFVFGKHLVGDWNSGNIYEMSVDYLDDDGAVIRRERVTPPISTENERIYHDKLTIDLETGLGPEIPLVDGDGRPRDPQLILSWTDDGGHTWSNDKVINCGSLGQYKKRAIKRRLGVARTRSYRVVVTDPIHWRFVDAYLKASGFQPSSRVDAEYRKVA